MNLDKTPRNISFIELLKQFLCNMFIANSWEIVYFANKPNVQWGLNNFFLIHLCVFLQLISAHLYSFFLIHSKTIWLKTYKMFNLRFQLQRMRHFHAPGWVETVETVACQQNTLLEGLAVRWTICKFKCPYAAHEYIFYICFLLK